MQSQIAELVEQFESGTISRRELVSKLTVAAGAIAFTGGAVQAAEAKPTFEAVGLNHIALRVTDVDRSRDFYKKHLGMEVRREAPGRNCFMTCGDHFVALFRGDAAAMDHYCYSIKDYDQKQAAATLRKHGIEPDTPEGTNRIYFPDPDGLIVQLAAKDHRP